MKRIKISLAYLSVLSTILFASCYADKGNYDYNWISGVSIEFEEAKVVIERGDLLTVTPILYETKLNEYGNPTEEKVQVTNYEDYDFIWYVVLKGERKRIVLSEKWNLDEQIFLRIASPDSHRIELHVTHKETGVDYSSFFSLEVIGTYKKGFIFLTDDDEGNVDLQLYAQIASDDWVIEKGILERAEYPYRTGHANVVLYQKYCLTNTSTVVPARIWVATGDGVAWIDPVNFEYDPLLNNITNLMVPDPAHSLVNMQRVGPIGDKIFSSSYMLFTDEGTTHMLNRAGRIRPDVSLVDYSPIQLAPMFGGDNNGGVLWDMTNKRFVSLFVDSSDNAGAISCKLLPDESEEATGGECLHLGTSNANSCIGITRNTDGRYYKYEWRFYSRFVPKPPSFEESFQYRGKTELTGTAALGTIDHWVLSTTGGDVYALAGNKLYCYRTYPHDISLNEWQEVIFKNTEDATITPTFDPTTLMFVENFGAPYASCFYMTTYSEANGGVVYILEPYPSEPTEVKIVQTIEGLDRIKSMSYWGY